jgi:hypothetical protein
VKLVGLLAEEVAPCKTPCDRQILAAAKKKYRAKDDLLPAIPEYVSISDCLGGEAVLANLVPREQERRPARGAFNVCSDCVDFDFETSYAAAFPHDGDRFRLLGRYCHAGGCGDNHNRRSFAAILDPRMDCHRGAGIARYREHNGFVELGTQAGSGISSGNFRELRTAGRRDSRGWLAAREFGAYGSGRGALIVGGALYFSYKPESSRP